MNKSNKLFEETKKSIQKASALKTHSMKQVSEIKS